MIKEQELMIEGPTGQLETLLVLDDKVSSPHSVLVFNHPNPTQGGTNRNKVVTTIAKVFAKRGFAVFLPNLRGTGKSEGSFSEGPGEKEDMLAIISIAETMFPSKNQTVIGGFSFGGFVSTLAADDSGAKDVLLIAPALVKYAIKSPILPNHRVMMIFGNEDEVIPNESIWNYAEEQGCPVFVVPNATHFFHHKLNLLADLIDKHFPFSEYD